MHIQENISLKDLTTFKIGGLARYFAVVKNLTELREAIIFSKEKDLPFFVLGGGSNILVSDKGFDGLVIKNEIRNKACIEMSADSSIAVFGAGENWDEAVDYTILKNLYGLENLSGVPGTVGATPVQNIGAYGQEIMNVLCSVKVLDTESLEEKIFTNSDCRFSYRDSFFKKKENKKYIITEVSFLLKKDGQVNIGYKDLQLHFLGKNVTKPSLREVREAVLDIRKNKLPQLDNHGLAGSFFKNLIVNKDKYIELKAKYPLMPAFFETEDKAKVPLAWILDNVLGLNGYREGNVGLYQKQPIVLVNYGEATEKEVSDFAKKIQDIIKDKIGVEVGWEVELII